MDSDLQMQLDLSNRLPVVNDRISPHLLSESFLRSTFCQLNTQGDNVIGLPTFSSLQWEPLKDFQADRNGTYDGLLSKGHLDVHEPCLGGTPLVSGSLGTLVSRDGLNDDVSDPVVPLQQEVQSESLREMFSSGYPYASSSSIPTAINCNYDGLVGDINGKWDQSRFMMQSELNWRTSTSWLEPILFSENQDTNRWLLPQSENVCTNQPYGTLMSQNELSLSLATCRPSLPCSASIQDRGSDMRCSNDINSHSQTRLGLECNSHGSKELSLGFASRSRPTQFSPILSGSRYLGVLQQILSEVASYSNTNVDPTSLSTGLMSSSVNRPYPSSHFNDPGISFKRTSEFCDDDGSFDQAESSHQRQEVEVKKSQLLALLQVVDDCYNRCLDEIHTVISAFHAATELDPQVHGSCALRTISFLYKNLRERISNEILAMGTNNGSSRDNGKAFEKCFFQKQWALQQLKRKDQQLWRPQRGLPERSVSVLRAWMFENFLHPYPKDSEKHLLAIRSGLTRSQVSNWFINARVRLWKPLVEEMCAEMNRRKGGHQNDEVTNHNTLRNQLSIYEYKQGFNP